MENIKCLNKSSIKLLNKYNLLKPLVKADLISSKISSIKFSEDDKNRLIEKFLIDNKIKEKKIFDDWVIKTHGSNEKFEESFLNSHRFRVFCKQNFFHKTEERFLSTKNNLDKVVYSLIRVKDYFLATELYLQINERENDFGKLANQYSEGEEKHSHGVIGPVSLSQAHPRVVEILKSIKINEINQPVKVDKWYVIIRLDSLVESTLDETLKQQLAEEIFDELIENEATQKVIELIKEANTI